MNRELKISEDETRRTVSGVIED